MPLHRLAGLYTPANGEFFTPAFFLDTQQQVCREDEEEEEEEEEEERKN